MTTDNNQEDVQRKPTMAEVFINYLSKTHPKFLFLHLIWIMVASMALSSSYIIAFHFTSLVAIYHESSNLRTSAIGIRLSNRQTTEISAMLTELLQTSNASRVGFMRYHTPIEITTGVPFVYHSMVVEVIRPGTNRLAPQHQNVPVLITPILNQAMAENRCFWINRADADPNSSAYWYWSAFGSRAAIRCPVYLPNGDITGHLSIDWIANVDNPQEWEGSLRAIATRVRTILDK